MNKGQFTSERAREIGKVGALKFAEAKRGTSSAPLCVACLYRIGLGIKRIVRQTGCAKTTVHRFMRMHGLSDEFLASVRRDQANRLKKRKAEAKRMERAAAQERKKAERLSRPKKTEMDYYYANHERYKERSRINAIARYHREAKAIKAGAEPTRYWVARRVRSRVYQVIKRAIAKKSVRTEELCGCSWDCLIQHIESQFYARMSWANYGRAWHIDHIMPCASFDLRDPAQQKQCFHYTNLRPLWARTNRRKWAIVTDPQFALLLPAA